jgi:hypothetical protein
MQENLVIVESPAKAKTIEKFLGKDFVVKSSFGHIRDLSKKDLGVNLDKDYDEDEEVKIIRTKKFSMKPMYPEDACVQMELLGHDFFVFINAETEDVNVVYKRKGNTYGLIEPEN